MEKASAKAALGEAGLAKVKAIVLASVMLFCLGSLLFAGSGTVTITAVTDGGFGGYTLTVNSSSGMTVGDHFGARLASGAGAIYEVMSIDGTSVVVSDTLTEERGSAFGAPVVGSGWFATPTTNDLSKPPYGGPGWDAALRRNAHLLDDSAGIDLSNLTITGGTISGVTVGTLDADLAVADGGTGAGTASDARTNLGVAIGADVQAYDADLAALAAISGQQGDVIYHNGTSWVRLAAGTDGQVLTTGGAAANPAWETSSGSASGRLIHYEAIQSQQTQDPIAYTLPAGTLASDGDMLKVTFTAQFVHTNNSTFYVEAFGSTLTTGSMTADTALHVDIWIVRTSSSALNRVVNIDRMPQSQSVTGGTITASRVSTNNAGLDLASTAYDFEFGMGTATGNYLQASILVVEYFPAP